MTSTPRVPSIAVSRSYDNRVIYTYVQPRFSRRDAPQVGNSAAGQRDETRRLQRPHPVVLRVVLDLGQMQGLQDRRNVHAEPTAQSFLQTVPPADRVFRGPSPGFDRAVHCRLLLVCGPQEHPVAVGLEHLMQVVDAPEVVEQLRAPRLHDERGRSYGLVTAR